MCVCFVTWFHREILFHFMYEREENAQLSLVSYSKERRFRVFQTLPDSWKNKKLLQVLRWFLKLVYYRDYLRKIWRNSKIHGCQPILENYRHWLLNRCRLILVMNFSKLEMLVDRLCNVILDQQGAVKEAIRRDCYNEDLISKFSETVILNIEELKEMIKEPHESSKNEPETTLNVTWSWSINGKNWGNKEETSKGNWKWQNEESNWRRRRWINQSVKKVKTG